MELTKTRPLITPSNTQDPARAKQNYPIFKMLGRGIAHTDGDREELARLSKVIIDELKKRGESTEIALIDNGLRIQVKQVHTDVWVVVGNQVTTLKISSLDQIHENLLAGIVRHPNLYDREAALNASNEILSNAKFQNPRFKRNAAIFILVNHSPIDEQLWTKARQVIEQQRDEIYDTEPKDNSHTQTQEIVRVLGVGLHNGIAAMNICESGVWEQNNLHTLSADILKALLQKGTDTTIQVQTDSFLLKIAQHGNAVRIMIDNEDHWFFDTSLETVQNTLLNLIPITDAQDDAIFTMLSKGITHANGDHKKLAELSAAIIDELENRGKSTKINLVENGLHIAMAELNADVCIGVGKNGILLKESSLDQIYENLLRGVIQHPNLYGQDDALRVSVRILKNTNSQNTELKKSAAQFILNNRNPQINEQLRINARQVIGLLRDKTSGIESEKDSHPEAQKIAGVLGIGLNKGIDALNVCDYVFWGRNKLSILSADILKELLRRGTNTTIQVPTDSFLLEMEQVNNQVCIVIDNKESWIFNTSLGALQNALLNNIIDLHAFYPEEAIVCALNHILITNQQKPPKLFQSVMFYALESYNDLTPEFTSACLKYVFDHIHLFKKDGNIHTTEIKIEGYKKVRIPELAEKIICNQEEDSLLNIKFAASYILFNENQFSRERVMDAIRVVTKFTQEFLPIHIERAAIDFINLNLPFFSAPEKNQEKFVAFYENKMPILEDYSNNLKNIFISDKRRFDIHVKEHASLFTFWDRRRYSKAIANSPTLATFILNNIDHEVFTVWNDAHPT